MASAISGTGTLTKLGAGTTTLTGDEHLQRQHDDQRGHAANRQRRHAGTLGTGAVINNAALAFNRSDALTVANIISGTGTLTQTGTGTTTLTGTNTYTGGTTISAGTLQIGDGGTTGSSVRATSSTTAIAGVQSQRRA